MPEKTSDKVSTMQPFAPGDIFVGCTLLNNPADDHAGDGRILQYDANLKEKGVLWTVGTQHLVNGLRFAPDGTLWAFDQHNYAVLRVGKDGKQILPNQKFADRAFSNVSFGADGSLYFGEHLRGDKAPTMGTHLTVMPGTTKFGDGHIFKYAPDGRLLKEYATETHGGLPGFLGVTCARLAPDGRRMVYLSETGNRIFQYDIAADRQLPDLATYAPGREGMVLQLNYAPDGKLMVSRSGRIEVMDDKTGTVSKIIPLEGPGWASFVPSKDRIHVFAANFLTGELAKIVMETGAKVASVQHNIKRALAGAAEYTG